MEYTQWESLSSGIPDKIIVLILVVMEYTQWGKPFEPRNERWQGLNPCCNGIYSMSVS